MSNILRICLIAKNMNPFFILIVFIGPQTVSLSICQDSESIRLPFYIIDNYSLCVNENLTFSAHNKINRGSYMTVHVLLNLLNELGKRDKMRGLPSILSLFRNEFNKINNTRARMLDSVYHMTLRLL